MVSECASTHATAGTSGETTLATNGYLSSIFTVGVGQAIAGLPLFSGMGYRLIVSTVLTALAILYVELYARRIRGPARRRSR